MLTNKIVNISGLGWTGSTLLIELLQQVGVGVYHQEFNFFRHPMYDVSIQSNKSKPFMKLCMFSCMCCFARLRQPASFSLKFKVLIELILLQSIALLSIFVRNQFLSDIYIKSIFMMYSKDNVLLVDQMFFPEDLKNVNSVLNFSSSYEYYHVYVLRKNVVRIMRERSDEIELLQCKTPREKFLIGSNLRISESIIFGLVAESLYNERKDLLEQYKLKNLKITYFEDLVNETEASLLDVLNFIKIDNSVTSTCMREMVKIAAKSRKNL